MIKNNPDEYISVGEVRDVRRKEWLTRNNPTALEALQAIANLPTGSNEEVMAGHEDSYRAVERLFAEPPVIHARIS
ncbi:hypothetical protein AGR4C_Cc100048 [Agrobacterium tumefaciens str. Kerr 14]|uniref:Uncharacterized protein n=1 Tax=Agrobacterium tumefaciens str. Kerr 14 TaxID=1183424 RepID=A0A1S7NLR2_AGRTU|nr:hypothetical protein [Agrobacterium tumefaciens]CUX08590.1 hypothetical protein AGR4C_Cc100048 [Agrobacterium tumefaciens str. Kerr 14]